MMNRPTKTNTAPKNTKNAGPPVAATPNTNGNNLGVYASPGKFRSISGRCALRLVWAGSQLVAGAFPTSALVMAR